VRFARAPITRQQVSAAGDAADYEVQGCAIAKRAAVLADGMGCMCRLATSNAHGLVVKVIDEEQSQRLIHT
jgi:hypothetical protein